MNNTKQITKICENKEGASAVYGPQKGATPFIPAICAVVVTILLSTMLSKKQGVQVTENDLEQKEIRI